MSRALRERMQQLWVLIMQPVPEDVWCQNRKVMKNKQDVLKRKREIREFEAEQRNAALSDTLLRSHRVDEPIWKGSPDAPLVQRIGACAFGLCFISAGVVFLSLGFQKYSWILGIFAIGWFLVGGRMLWNAFRK
jgi:hypothetical protein